MGENSSIAAAAALNAPRSESDPSSQRPGLGALPGGTVIWIFIVLELLTFFGFFIGYAATYAGDPATFAASQALLSPLSGTINTVVLLTGSWMVARAVADVRAGGSGWLWMAATALSGVIFSAIKVAEYSHTLVDGISLSTNPFWFYYIFLTVFHLYHVVAGVGFTAYVAWRQRPKSKNQLDGESVESAAMYWHLIDLIWIVLFPLLYLVGVPS